MMIDRSSALSGASALSGPATGGPALTAARQLVGDLGARVIAWADALGGGAGAAGAWSGRTGAGVGSTDAQTLSRGGDVYGLRELTRAAASAVGAGPAEEGALHRAVERLAHHLAVQQFGLSGASAEQRLERAAEAWDAVQADTTGDGPPALVERIERAADRLEQAAQ